ncbi:hypothetical protein HELRODRAFT_173594 [Helobdella robusta]|uniref:Uncharacterized protein n=1 Tax=Helobdella robusta TaxID=6412 RepID=T1F701_HELRO|nr:hypothetical protein HELRODRAFT_173594 [Helobdella robusta]ESO03309.1 hypothetical protein HELRODRAFT_173594 [Helobdella robusta]
MYSTCSFWFLPVFEPTLKDNHGNGERFYKCFVQWALWQLDCYISVYWQNYLAHDFETLNVSSYCQKFIDSFTSCKNSTTHIEKCILKNAKIFFSNDSITKLTHWFEALNLLNFQLKRSDSTSVCLTNSSMILHPVRHHSFENHIEYNNANLNISQLYYTKTCSENVSAFMNLTKVINLAKPWIQQPNVLLLIVFNYPHFEIIPLLESIHRPLYPYILYCGSEMLKRNLTLLYRLSFVTYNQPYGHNAGAFNYQCIMKAIRMGYDLDGIFLIADDIFIKTELIKVPTKNNKFCTSGILGNLKLMKQCSSLTNCSNPMTWIWWGGFRSGLHRMFWDWSELGERHPDLKLALQRLQNVTGGEMRMYGNTGDIAFLSKKYFKTAYKLLHLFLKYGLFLEIAIPTVLNSVTTNEDVYNLAGHMDWSNNRHNPYHFIKNATMYNKHFAHPMKLSCVLNKDKKCLKMYCNCLLPYLHDPKQGLCTSI